MSKRPKHVIAEDRELMTEWNYETNSKLGLNPETIGMASHTNVWWKCSAGHSWFAMVSNRSRHNRACPYCAHQLPIPGENDLATLFPDLAKEWHPKKNNSKPSEVMPGAHKKAWWICSEGHEWEAEIKSRTTGVGCPYCCGKRVMKGYNDLATVNPDLAAEWHPTKNGDLTPEDVTEASGKKSGGCAKTVTTMKWQSIIASGDQVAQSVLTHYVRLFQNRQSFTTSSKSFTMR